MEKTKAKRIKDSTARLLNSEQIARRKASLLGEIYLRSLKDIRRDLDAFYKRYSDETGLSPSEIARTLGGVDLQTHINKIQSLMSKIGILEDVYSENLYAQITRLEALQEEVYWRIRSDVNNELKVHDSTYAEIAKKNYLANASGVGLVGINKRALNVIVNDRWLGQNFSERCVLNNERVARQFSYLIGQQVVMGTSLSKLSRMLSERNDIRLAEAQRLVRTEANNVHNQSDLQFYKDSGYIKYEFVATLDMHTSDICKKLDGQVFNTDEAVVGQNFPPMHPNCRSTTIAVVEDDVEAEKQIAGIPRQLRTDELLEQGGADAELPAVTSVDELIQRWGLPTRFKDNLDTIRSDKGNYTVKIKQGADKSLNAESEWIMAAYGELEPEKQAYAHKRVKKIIDVIEPSQRNQIEMVFKYMGPPKVK